MELSNESLPDFLFPKRILWKLDSSSNFIECHFIGFFTIKDLNNYLEKINEYLNDCVDLVLTEKLFIIEVLFLN